MPTQRWDAEGYARNARFVAELAQPLVDLLAPRPGEHILDLGCGDGVLSAAIARSGARVTAVDASPEMVAAARLRGIDARVMRGEALDFADAFDAVFSNAALHWMGDLDAVLAGVARTLRPNGRFIAEMGGAGNVATVTAPLEKSLARRGLRVRAPWIFPEPKAVTRPLTRHGFAIDALALIDRPTLLPGEIADWLETFAGAYLDAVPIFERAALREEVAAALRQSLHGPSGWTLDYVRLRFAAHFTGQRLA